VAPLEPAFFATCVELLGIDPTWVTRRDDPAQWPDLRDAIAAAVRTRSRDEWDALARGTDACVAGVLDLAEAQTALADRFWEPPGAPGPMPRPPGASEPLAPPPGTGSIAAEALARWGTPE
jgi:alpha-methylacyl-CoA racemase